MPDNFVKRTASFMLTQKASVTIFPDGVVQSDLFINVIIISTLLITDRSVNVIPLYYSNESVIMNYRVTSVATFPDSRYLLSKSTITM